MRSNTYLPIYVSTYRLHDKGWSDVHCQLVLEAEVGLVVRHLPHRHHALRPRRACGQHTARGATSHVSRERGGLEREKIARSL